MKDHIERIFKDVLEELERANEKFPESNHNGIALMEEVGEFAKAMLHIEEEADGTMGTQVRLREDVYKEGIQSITMVLKLMTRGDSSTRYKGIFCSYANCTQREIGGPCPKCYE